MSNDIKSFLISRFSGESEFDTLCRELDVENIYTGNFDVRITGLLRHLERRVPGWEMKLRGALLVLCDEGFHAEIEGLLSLPDTGSRLLSPLPPIMITLIGRKTEMKDITKQLAASRQVLLLNGMGGIGKTELAKQYFYDMKNTYTYAAWVDYRGSVKEALVDQMKIPGITDRGELNINDVFQRVVEYLQNMNCSMLFVIDNIDNPDDNDLTIIHSLPDTVKVIATSRHKVRGFNHIYLDILTPGQCRELFYTHYTIEHNDDMLDNIIDLTGGHTLTVELLAKTAEAAGMGPAELYDVLIKQGFDIGGIIGEHVTTTWHDEKDQRTFFEHMRKVFAIANLTDGEMYVLTNMCLMPNLYMDKKTIKEWLGLDSGNDVNSLLEKGWLLKQEQGGQVRMHQVIADVVRYETKPDMETCGVLFLALAYCLSYEPGENPLLKKKYVPFVKSMLDRLDDEHEGRATLASNLSLIYLNLGNPDQALHYQKKALVIREKVLDVNHLDLAKSYHGLSTIYWSLGDLEQALHYQKKALVIRVKALDANHIDLVPSYNTLSLIYRDLGNLDQALHYQKKAVLINEKGLSVNHPDLVISYSNLSTIYWFLDELDQALHYQNKALVISEKVLDINHPELAKSYGIMSLIYWSMCDFNEAIQYQKKALMIMEKMFDANHPDLATSYHNLAGIYLGQKDYTNAHLYAQKAVAILEKVFPDGHPNLDNARKCLAMISLVMEVLSREGDLKDRLGSVPAGSE